MLYDVVIIGGGPAGLTAGIYAGRSGVKTLVIEKYFSGGQASETYEIENYPGFVKVGGFELTQEMEKQATACGAEMIFDEIESISKEDTVGYRDKLEERLRKILGDNSIEVDEQRLLTECAVWADKIAIDEELVRLRSHFGAFYDIAEAKEPSGRKLDFLMQEMNRETNTIGSKANNARIARLVVNIKGELEKIREQVQNIE